VTLLNFDVRFTPESGHSSTPSRCPIGANNGHWDDQGRVDYYRANKNECSAYALKAKCTTAVVRKVTRDLDEEVREHVRALASTEAFEQSRRERKKVEMRFAHMKRILKLDRLRLRGFDGPGTQPSPGNGVILTLPMIPR
jgi:hypothetical protein